MNEDKAKVNEILAAIGKQDVKPAYVRRLRSKTSKPGPILVELQEESLRNPILVEARKLRSISHYSNVYISPDLTEAERQQDFALRTERNRLNNTRSESDPFWYGIRGNQIQKFKKKQQ